MSCWKGFRQWLMGPKKTKQKYKLPSSLWLDDPLLDEQSNDMPYYNASFVLNDDDDDDDDDDEEEQYLTHSDAITDESRYENMLMHDSVIDAHVNNNDSIVYAEKYLLASDISITDHVGRNSDHSLYNYTSCLESPTHSTIDPETTIGTSEKGKGQRVDKSQGTGNVEGSFGNSQGALQGAKEANRKTYV